MMHLVAGGRVHCAPADGMAVQDTFTLVTEGWYDDDRPLSYRFGTSMAGGSPVMVRCACAYCCWI
jgi:hypothetical protein